MSDDRQLPSDPSEIALREVKHSGIHRLRLDVKSPELAYSSNVILRLSLKVTGSPTIRIFVFRPNLSNSCAVEF